uniref:Uncharacterized protein n=1 Tax=uncultured bacterium Rlip2 TaxID=581115 RepID=C0K086_9BACT|nr:unknown [uncultured bacterium Rlip2]
MHDQIVAGKLRRKIRAADHFDFYIAAEFFTEHRSTTDYVPPSYRLAFFRRLCWTWFTSSR